MTVVRGVCKQCVRLINTIEGWLPWLKRLYFAICLFANEKWCCAHLMGTWINEGANKLEELACNSNWHVAADCCAFIYIFMYWDVLNMIEWPERLIAKFRCWPAPSGAFFAAAVFLQGARVLQTTTCSRHIALHGIVRTSHGFSMF